MTTPMTIDEAIKHCDEVAEELEKRVKPYQCESINKKLYELNSTNGNPCYSCGKYKLTEQQPCEEAISRAYVESIVEELENICINGDDYILSLLSRIKNAPSVTPQPNKSEIPTGWIPVSERLPKAYEFVNCTCHSLIDDREDWVIETVYIPQPSDSPYSDWGNIPMLNSGDCKVVAWMHRDIPEPYKAESEEENG